MKLLLTCLFAIAATGMLHAQQNASQEKPQLSYKSGSYLVDGQKITASKFEKLISDDPEAVKLIKSGQGLGATGNVFACMGGACIGWDLGSRMAGNEGNAALLAGGGGLIIIGIIFSASGSSRIKKGIELYNNPRTAESIRLGFAGEGVGISMRF